MAGQFVIPSSFSEEARLVISRIMWIEPRKRLDLGRVFKTFLAFFQAKKFSNFTGRLGEKTFSNSVSAQILDQPFFRQYLLSRKRQSESEEVTREADSSEVEIETPKKRVKVRQPLEPVNVNHQGVMAKRFNSVWKGKERVRTP